MVQATLGQTCAMRMSIPIVNPLWISLGLGLLGALAMPPLSVWIALPFAFSGFLWVLKPVNTPKRAFWLGWFFGFGYFLGSLYWLGNAPRTLGLWLAVPFACVGLPIVLAIFPAIATYLTVRATSHSLSRVFAFAAFWSLFEWLRGHVFTGLPWNLLGYAWDTPLLQVTSIIGIYGLSALTVLAASIFAIRHKGWIAGVVLSLIVLTVWGDYRLTQAGRTEMHPVNLRIVQASIPQQTKWLAEHFQENLDRYIALSHLPAEKPLTTVIWPESSVPTFVEHSPPLLKILAEAAPSRGLVIFGAPREVQGKLRTSMMALDDQGQFAGVYDKSHLVPFGEYMPLRSIFPLKKLTYGDRDYTPGSGIQTLSLPHLPSLSPLICYEAIFPHAVVEEKNRPHWMLNLTNDAWYGNSSGPYQHLQIVRVRAIEEGIPLIRAANNGISAVIDAWGRILYRLEIDEVGFIDFALPQRIEAATLYHRWGDLPFWGILAGLFLVAIGYRRSIQPS